MYYLIYLPDRVIVGQHTDRDKVEWLRRRLMSKHGAKVTDLTIGYIDKGTPVLDHTISNMMFDV